MLIGINMHLSWSKNFNKKMFQGAIRFKYRTAMVRQHDRYDCDMKKTCRGVLELPSTPLEDSAGTTGT